MTSFLLASQNLPFAVALALMLIIAAVEGASLAIGAGVSGVLDKLIPSIDFDTIEAPEISNTSGVTQFLGWLRIGKVPFLITLIIFLTLFGLTGLFIQSFVQSLTGWLLPAPVAVVPALVIVLPLLRVSHGVVSRIIPKDETYAVTEDSLLGKIAVITSGTATAERGAQGRVKDEYRKDHYILIKPDNEKETFSRGTSVLLVRKSGAFFYAIFNPNPKLID